MEKRNKEIYINNLKLKNDEITILKISWNLKSKKKSTIKIVILNWWKIKKLAII